MLITELAYLALLLAVVLATLQVVLPIYGIFSNRDHWQQSAPLLAVGQAMAWLLAFFGLMAGFYYNDFSLVYIAEHSNSLLPWYYKLSATWAGHEGSLLLWLTILAFWGAMVAIFSRSLPLGLRARTLSIVALIQWMMGLMLLTYSSPFVRSVINGQLALPVDGADLNPLLQDFGLIVHPPILYMGYVGMAIPFAFCVSALWLGELNSASSRWLRPWLLSAWGFLTLGIALGSWWAYYELGWGGWWFWDPVENASLLPWLASTALLHALTITTKRGLFKAWTIMLAILTFALSLLGTFLVRSGVITSVHSFTTDPSRGVSILLILAVLIGSSLLLFALRGWRLSIDSDYQLKSRESLLIMNNIILLVATLTVLLGTLYPIIADSMGLGQLSVGSPYFNTLIVPLAWLLLAVLGVGVVLRWRRDKRRLLPMAIKVAISSLLLTLIIIIISKPNALINVAVTVFLSLWVLAWSAYDMLDKRQKLTLNYGAMQLAHVGLLLTALGVAVSSSESIEKDMAMRINDTLLIEDYQFTMLDIYQAVGSNYDSIVADIEISKDDTIISHLYPEKRTYLVSIMPMTESAIYSTIWQDMYVALGEPINDKSTATKSAMTTAIINNSGEQLENREQWAVRIYIKPFVRFIWLGALMMALGAVLAIVGNRNAKNNAKNTVKRKVKE